MAGIPADWDHRPPPKLNPRTYAFFRPDRVSFQKFILSEQMRSPVALVAHEIMALARTKTPRGQEDGDGHVQDGYELHREAGELVVGDSFPYPRVKVEISNSHRAAAPLEFGNSRTKKRRMLGRAGAAFGDLKGKVGA